MSCGYTLRCWKKQILYSCWSSLEIGVILLLIDIGLGVEQIDTLFTLDLFRDNSFSSTNDYSFSYTKTIKWFHTTIDTRMCVLKCHVIGNGHRMMDGNGVNVNEGWPNTVHRYLKLLVKGVLMMECVLCFVHQR